MNADDFGIVKFDPVSLHGLTIQPDNPQILAQVLNDVLNPTWDYNSNEAAIIFSRMTDQQRTDVLDLLMDVGVRDNYNLPPSHKPKLKKMLDRLVELNPADSDYAEQLSKNRAELTVLIAEIQHLPKKVGGFELPSVARQVRDLNNDQTIDHSEISQRLHRQSLFLHDLQFGDVFDGFVLKEEDFARFVADFGNSEKRRDGVIHLSFYQPEISYGAIGRMTLHFDYDGRISSCTLNQVEVPLDETGYPDLSRFPQVLRRYGDTPRSYAQGLLVEAAKRSIRSELYLLVSLPDGYSTEKFGLYAQSGRYDQDFQFDERTGMVSKKFVIYDADNTEVGVFSVNCRIGTDSGEEAKIVGLDLTMAGETVTGIKDKDVFTKEVTRLAALRQEIFSAMYQLAVTNLRAQLYLAGSNKTTTDGGRSLTVSDRRVVDVRLPEGDLGGQPPYRVVVEPLDSVKGAFSSKKMRSTVSSGVLVVDHSGSMSSRSAGIRNKAMGLVADALDGVPMAMVGVSSGKQVDEAAPVQWQNSGEILAGLPRGRGRGATFLYTNILNGAKMSKDAGVVFIFTDGVSDTSDKGKGKAEEGRRQMFEETMQLARTKGLKVRIVSVAQKHDPELVAWIDEYNQRPDADQYDVKLVPADYKNLAAVTQDIAEEFKGVVIPVSQQDISYRVTIQDAAGQALHTEVIQGEQQQSPIAGAIANRPVAQYQSTTSLSYDPVLGELRGDLTVVDTNGSLGKQGETVTIDSSRFTVLDTDLDIATTAVPLVAHDTGKKVEDEKVAFVIDTSGSMNGTLGSFKQAMVAFIDNVHVLARDVYTFLQAETGIVFPLGDHSYVNLTGTTIIGPQRGSDQSAVEASARREIEGLKAEGNSPGWQTLYRLYQDMKSGKLPKDPFGRIDLDRIVVVTDGEWEQMDLSWLPDFIDICLGNGIEITVAAPKGFRVENNPDRIREVGVYSGFLTGYSSITLQEVALITGGSVITGEDMPSTVEAMEKQLYYSKRFEIPNPIQGMRQATFILRDNKTGACIEVSARVNVE
ncbi:MAG: hypothetical protein ABIE84_07330 [bacterium]